MSFVMIDKKMLEDALEYFKWNARPQSTTCGDKATVEDIKKLAAETANLFEALIKAID